MEGQGNSARLRPALTSEGTWPAIQHCLNGPEIKTEDELSQLIMHPDFGKYQQAIISMVDAPAALLREILRLKAGAQWCKQRQRLLEIWNKSQPASVPSLVTDTLLNHRRSTINPARVAKSPADQTHVNASNRTSEPTEVLDDCADEHSMTYATLTVPKSCQKIKSKKLYSCGGPRCQSKVYKRLGDFQNHMTCVHQLTGFDPASYLLTPDYSKPQHELHTSDTKVFSEPRPSVSSGSTTWSDSSQGAPSTEYASLLYHPMTSHSLHNVSRPTVHNDFHLPLFFGNGEQSQRERPPTPFNRDSTGNARAGMSNRMSWLPTTNEPVNNQPLYHWQQ